MRINKFDNIDCILFLKGFFLYFLYTNPWVDAGQLRSCMIPHPVFAAVIFGERDSERERELRHCEPMLHKRHDLAANFRMKALK